MSENGVTVTCSTHSGRSEAIVAYDDCGGLSLMLIRFFVHRSSFAADDWYCFLQGNLQRQMQKAFLLPNISRKETGRPLRQIGRSGGCGDVTINFLLNTMRYRFH